MKFNYYFFVKRVSKLTFCFILMSSYLYAQNISPKMIKDIEYRMGKTIGGLLTKSYDYSVSLAEIKHIQPTKVGREIHSEVTFKILTPLLPNDFETNKEKEITVRFRETKSNPIIIGDSVNWYQLVDKNLGTKVIIFHKKFNNKQHTIGFLTSDTTYFAKVENSIELFTSFKADENNLIKYFASKFDSDKDLNKAVAIRYLIKDSHNDIVAHVITKMLEKTALSNKKEGLYLLNILTSKLTIQLENVFPELRAGNFERLIKTAARKDKAGLDATWALISIARFNSSELRKYLKSETKYAILTNLETLTQNRLGLDEGEALRRLLS